MPLVILYWKLYYEFIASHNQRIYCINALITLYCLKYIRDVCSEWEDTSE